MLLLEYRLIISLKVSLLQIDWLCWATFLVNDYRAWASDFIVPISLNQKLSSSVRCYFCRSFRSVGNHLGDALISQYAFISLANLLMKALTGSTFWQVGNDFLTASSSIAQQLEQVIIFCSYCLPNHTIYRLSLPADRHPLFAHFPDFMLYSNFLANYSAFILANVIFITNISLILYRQIQCYSPLGQTIIYCAQSCYIQQYIANQMINNLSSPSFQAKILAEMAALNKKKNMEEKISYIKLDKKQEQEAEQLFDQVQPAEEKSKKESGQKQRKKKDEGTDIKKAQNQDRQPQNKYISILRKTEIGKQLIEGKRKVKFADEGEGYIVVEGGRRWNEKLKDPRKGKFDPAEKRLLIQSLSQCLTLANLSYEEVVRTMTEDQEKIPRNLNFWTKVCSVLPDRTLVSSYKFLKRELNEKNKGGQWTEDETNRLLELVDKVGRKWSLIAKQMHRSAQNIRDKYRLIGQQKYDPSSEQTVWKFNQLVTFLAFLQKYSKKNFLKQQIEQEVQKHNEHDQIQLKQMKNRKYNSKTFNFHNNEVVRRYITKQFNQIKVQDVNWQKIADKMQTKTIFDCRNKFVQLLQLEICGMGSQQFYEAEIVKFITKQRPRYETDIKWQQWRNEQVSEEEARNRWMILKRHIQGRGQRTFQQLMEKLAQKYAIRPS